MYLLGHKGASKTRFIEPREPLCEVPPIDAFLPPFPFLSNNQVRHHLYGEVA